MTTTVLTTIPTAPAAPPPTEAAAEASETTEATPASVEAPPPAAPETPKAPEPDQDLVIAQKLESVAKREARARKMEAQYQAKFAEIDTMKAELAKKLAEVDAALDDPVDHYIKRGKDPVEVAKRFARPATEEEKRLARLEAAQEKRDADERKRAEEHEKQAKEARRHEEMRQFVAGINPDEYPHLTSVYAADEVPGLVTKLLHRPHDPTDSDSPSVLQVFHAQYGRGPTPKEIRDALEHEAEIRAMSLIERIKPKGAAPSQVTPPNPPATEDSSSLSNQHAASSPSARAGKKSREEVMKELKAELEAETA